jgi:hypothetical protein
VKYSFGECNKSSDFVEFLVAPGICQGVGTADPFSSSWKVVRTGNSYIVQAYTAGTCITPYRTFKEAAAGTCSDAVTGQGYSVTVSEITSSSAAGFERTITLVFIFVLAAITISNTPFSRDV